MHLLDPGTQLLGRFPSHTGQWLSSASLGFLLSPICTHMLLLKPSTHPPAHPSIHHPSRHPPIHPPIHPCTVCLAWLSRTPTQVPSSAGHLFREHRSQPDPCSPEGEAGIRLCPRAPGASWVPLRLGFKALWVELRRGREKAVGGIGGALKKACVTMEWRDGFIWASWRLLLVLLRCTCQERMPAPSEVRGGFQLFFWHQNKPIFEFHFP